MAANANSNVAESKKAESTPAENSHMNAARAKGNVAVGIAKLQPSVRVLIAYAEIWTYYTLLPFKMGQLIMDVIMLGLEITKLSLIAVKANTNLFVQLFQQILAIMSPEFILNILHSCSTILTTLVEKIMKDLLNLVQKFVEGLAEIFKPQLIPVPGLHRSGEDSGTAGAPGSQSSAGKSGMAEAPASSDAGQVTPGSKDRTATPPKRVANDGTPEKSDKVEKSNKTGMSEQSEKSEKSTPKKG